MSRLSAHVHVVSSLQVNDEDDSVCVVFRSDDEPVPGFAHVSARGVVYACVREYMQGYEDNAEEDNDDDEDASYADEEYGASAKKKAPKKKKQPTKPRGALRLHKNIFSRALAVMTYDHRR